MTRTHRRGRKCDARCCAGETVVDVVLVLLRSRVAAKGRSRHLHATPSPGVSTRPAPHRASISLHRNGLLGQRGSGSRGGRNARHGSEETELPRRSGRRSAVRPSAPWGGARGRVGSGRARPLPPRSGRPERRERNRGDSPAASSPAACADRSSDRRTTGTGRDARGEIAGQDGALDRPMSARSLPLLGEPGRAEAHVTAGEGEKCRRASSPPSGQRAARRARNGELRSPRISSLRGR